MSNVVYLHYVPLHRFSFEKWACEGLDILGCDAWNEVEQNFNDFETGQRHLILLFSSPTSPFQSISITQILYAPKPNDVVFILGLIPTTPMQPQQHDASSNFPTGSHTCMHQHNARTYRSNFGIDVPGGVIAT